MPSQTVAENAAAAEFVLENRENVLHGIELYAGSLPSVAAERAHAPLHFVKHPPRLC
jgi:hypothetical protein